MKRAIARPFIGADGFIKSLFIEAGVLRASRRAARRCPLVALDGNDHIPIACHHQISAQKSQGLDDRLGDKKTVEGILMVVG